jgi:hypothetical protein
VWQLSLAYHRTSHYCQRESQVMKSRCELDVGLFGLPEIPLLNVMKDEEDAIQVNQKALELDVIRLCERDFYINIYTRAIQELSALMPS